MGKPMLSDATNGQRGGAPSFPAPTTAQDDAFVARLLVIFGVAYLPSLAWMMVPQSSTLTPEFLAWGFWTSLVLSAVPLLAAAAVLVMARRFPHLSRAAWLVGAIAVAATVLTVVTGHDVRLIQLIAWALILRHRLLMVGAGIAFAAITLPTVLYEVTVALDGPLFLLNGLALAWAVRIVPPAALLVLAVLQFRRNAAAAEPSSADADA
ncbi:hypothetical protein [Zhihengliuella sp.]|uniref:hypothetical protein n=1 Tax=Zhihengliuella sp. TaxID=1954483 RepID=UPI002811104B|nr:hypothetical protein [Zhihengliuella sp.]